MEPMTFLALAATVNCINSFIQGNLNRKTQDKRSQQLIKTRKQHDLWLMEQQDKRQYRKLDPLVDYDIEPGTTFVAVADYLPEKSIGSHIRISIEEMLRERAMAGFPIKVLGGGGCIRGDIRGEGMVKQLFFELCENLNEDIDSELLESINLVVCWGSVQPLMGRITPHISVFNMLNHSGELRTGSLSSIIRTNDSDESVQNIDLRLSENMREQLWKSVNFVSDTVSMLSCLQRAHELRNPFMADVLDQLNEDSKVQFKSMLLSYIAKYKKLNKGESSIQKIETYEKLLQASFEGKLPYSTFTKKTNALAKQKTAALGKSRLKGKKTDEVTRTKYISNGRLVLPDAIELMRKHFGSTGSRILHIAGAIPREKAARAKQSYANDIQSKEVLLLYDNTVFGSTKKGWLMTEKAIYSSGPISNDYPKNIIRKIEYKDVDINNLYYCDVDQLAIGITKKKKQWFLSPIFISTSKFIIIVEFFEELFSASFKQISKDNDNIPINL